MKRVFLGVLHGVFIFDEWSESCFEKRLEMMPLGTNCGLEKRPSYRINIDVSKFMWFTVCLHNCQHDAGHKQQQNSDFGYWLCSNEKYTNLSKELVSAKWASLRKFWQQINYACPKSKVRIKFHGKLSVW